MYLHNTHRRRCACLAFTTLAVLSLAGCGPKKQAAAPPPPPEVTVVTVHRTSVPVSVELPGRTAAYFMAQVRARVDGIVLKRTFQEGDDVKAGQLLYQIDPAPYRAMLNSAIATQQSMEANLAVTTTLAERYKVLVAGNAVSKQVYDNAVGAQQQAAASLAVAKAAVTTARINLGYTNVVSPITGRTGISQVTQGAYVQASAATLMNTVDQIDPIYVDVYESSVQGLQLLHDVESGRIKLNGPNQVKVTLTQEDGTQYPLAGKFQFSGIMVNPATGSVPLRIIFPNPKHVLLPGMFVRAHVDQGVNDAAMLVPEVGVTHSPQGQATVLVVGPDNKVVQRTVQTTRTIGDKWVVDDGLNDGDRVIVAGTQKVQPGTLVRAVESQTPATPAPGNVATATPAAPPSAPASQNAAASKSK